MGLYSLVIDLPLDITEKFNKISLLKIPDFPLKLPPKAKSDLGDASDQQRLPDAFTLFNSLTFLGVLW